MNQSGQKQSGELERRQQQQQQQQTSTITIRRHSRNRLVLIGRTPPGSTGANKTTDGQRRDGQGAGGAEQGAEQRRTMIDDRAASYGETDGSDTGLDDPELAQRHPSKLTHGFWMRRYSGLHGGTTTIEEQLRPSGSGLTATAGSRPQPVAGSSPVAVSGCRQPDRPRLLARWTNAWMLRGRRGSSCAGSASKLVHHQQAGGAAGGGVSSSPITGRSGASSAPPPASASSPAAGAACDNTGQGRPERTGGRCHRKHRTRQTSAAGGGHDGMTKAAGASASGASHSPFGCQFCGWRSGTHVARSSSYSSASSSTSSSSSSSDQQQHKKRPQAGSEGHESRPQQKDSNIERPLPRASSERPNQAKEEETTGRSLEFGSKSLLTDWLFRPATSSPVAANNSGSNSRMSPYRQVVHRLWGAHKQQQQDQAASTGVKILGDQQQQQQLDNQQRRRRLGSLLFTSPKKRSCIRVSDDHQPIKAKLHQSTTKAAAEAARGASSTDQENDDNESRGGGGGSSTKVADEDKTSRNAHEISIGADGSLMETTDPLGAEAMGGGGEWGNVAEKGNNFQLDRSPADFPNPSGRPSGSGSVSSSSWRPNESGEPDKQIQQQQLSRQMSVKDDNRLESRLLKQANGDNRFGRGGVDQTRISGLGESKDCSSGPTAHDVAKMDEESRHRADFQRAVTIDHEQNEGLVSSNNNSYREPDSEPLEFQQAKRLVSLAKAEFTSASPKAAATSGPNGPSETIAPDSLALGTPSSEASAFGTAGMAMQGISSSTSLLPLIQPLASSTSSLASSSICNLDSMLTTESTSQQHLAMAGKAAASTGQESSGGQAWSSMQQHELLQSYQPGDMVVVSLAADPTSPAWLDGDDNTEASSNNNNNTGPTNIKEQEEENKHLAHGGTGDVKVPLPRQPARQTTARPLSQPVSSSELMCRSGRIAGAQPPVLATSEPQQPQQPPAASTEVLKSNFKKLVKRQQSVDSYRMAREQKQKLKREQQERDHPGSGGVGPADGGGSGGRQHQSNEAIRICSIGVGELDRVASSGRTFSMRLTGKDEPNQGVSVVVGPGSGSSTGAQPRKGAINFGAAASGGEPASSMQKANFQVEICVDPYAQPGSFMLPGEQLGDANNDDDERNSEQEHHGGPAPLRADKQRNLKTSSKPKVSPTPPNTLSLMPAPVSGTGGSTCPSPASSLLMGSGFSGCITPTYPTHHLPSPKYVSPAAFAAMQKKHSNASTISSSLGIDSLTGGAMGSTTANQNGQMAGNDQSLLYESMSASAAAAVAAAASSPGQQIAGNHHQQQGILSSNQPSENGSSSFSLAASRRTSKSLGIGGRAGSDSNQQDGQVVASALTKEQAEAQARAEAEAAAAAQRRANLAEHIYDNKCGLGEDMKFLASLPEMCDITFLVGETREPVCAVKSVLAARSRVFHKILFGQRIEAAARAAVAAAEEAAAAQRHQANQESTAGQQHQDDGPSQTDADDHTRRASSPRQTGESGPLSVLASVSHLASKTSSRSNSPNQQAQQSNQQQQQQWSVIPDASGLSSRPATMARTDSTLASGGRSGRVSVASNGRESVSQASQGSQQPLIIGPGQTATPAPIKKGRKGRREDQLMGGGHSTGASAGGGHSRLSRMFLNKRASDPSIKHHQQQLQYQQQHGQATAGGALGAGTGLGTGDGSAASGYQGSRAANQSYLDKMSSSQRSTTVIIEEFEPDVFRQLIEYIHTGCVLLQARTLLGLLNAADYYGLEQLRRACLRFVSCCITVDTVCSLLSTAERYIQYKCTKSIVQKVLEFVDSHANDIFKLNAFGLLPEHVVRLILARDGLQADEQVKYEGVYTWCEHYCRSYELTNMSDVMQNFLDLIQFHKIPTNVLLTEIYPARIVPDEIFLSALAYQANPEVFEPQPSRQRRMTLPSSLMLGGRNTFGDERESHPDELISAKSKGAGARRQSNSPAATTRGHQHRRSILGLRKSAGSGEGSGAGGAANTAGDTGSTPSPAPNKPASSGRKGSLAQVSISGVKRFSHRLPLRKRHSNMPTSIVTIQSPTRSKPLSPQQGTPPPPAQQSPLDKSFSVALTETSDHTKQADSGRVGGSKRQLSLAQSNLTGPNDAATAAALAASAAAANSQDLSRDPIQLGRQILDAYLTAKRQQELEEEEEKERQREQAEAAKLNKTDASESFDCSSGAGGDQQQPSAEHSNRTGRLVSDPKSAMKRQPLVKTPSSSRKSFRDFKHISRRIFMRHSSSKSIQLQQQQSVLVGGVTTSSGGGGPLQQTKRVNSGDAGSGGGTRFSSIDKKLSADFQHNKGQQQQQETQTGRGRRLLRIKRSETVFEATTVNPESSSGHHGPSKLLHQLSANLKKS